MNPKPDQSFWQIKLVGGVRDGERHPSSAPYPIMKTPEADYRRVSMDREKMTAEYELVGTERTFG